MNDLIVDLYVKYKPGYYRWRNVGLRQIGDLNKYIETLARELVRDFEKRETYSQVCPHIQIKGRNFNEYDKCAEFYAETVISCEICKKEFYVTLDTEEGTVRVKEKM